MKNKKSNIWSFAAAKLQAKTIISLLILIFAVIGFSMAVVGCNSDEEEEVYNSPEEMPEAKRWAWKWDDASMAKIEYAVDAEGVCTIIVSGTADMSWRSHVAYMYTEKEGANYSYTFDAWTKTGARNLYVNYFENNDDEVYLTETIQITSTRTTYTIYGDTIPRLGVSPALRFQCGDQLGTFYVKIKEIKEYTTGKLTVTNFSFDFVKDSYIDGYLNYIDENDDYISLFFGASGNSAFQIKANTFTLTAFKRLKDKDGNLTISPFTWNTIAKERALILLYMHDDLCAQYRNKVPITFTNGNATINFGEQMEFQEEWEW